VSEALTAISSWINKDEGYENSYIVKEIMKHPHTQSGYTEDVAISTALRLLIHYVGDVHQPLHATTRVDHEFPTSDRGGNEFKLKRKDGADNLHMVWDAVIYKYSHDPNLVRKEG